MKYPIPLFAPSLSSRVRHARTKKEGAALIITLSILVLLSIVIVGMATTTRTERGASSSHLERFRAGLMAQEATETVVALFNSQTSNAIGYWASHPGVLITSPASSSASAASNNLDERIPLSSQPSSLAGSPTAKTASDNPAILNIQKLLAPSGAGPDRVIYNPATAYNPTADGMKLKWVYVHQDGTREWSETSETPDTSDPDNPVIGRYAYWVDDESSKINFNTAYSRAAQLNLPEQSRAPIGDPANVSLDALPDLDQNAATQIKTERDGQPFNSPEEAKRIADEAITQALQDSKFDVTHYGNSPNTTFFNEPRIVLTTKAANINPANLDNIEIQVNNAGPGIPYLNILNDESKDPGDINNIDPKKLTTVVNKLTKYLDSPDWPFVRGGGDSSFKRKYYNNNAPRLSQLAVNIIEYVRSKESQLVNPHEKPFVIPIRGHVTSGEYEWALASDEPASNSNGIIGATRTPMVNEIGLLKTAGGGVKVVVEIFLPRHYGIETVDLKNLSLYAAIYEASGSLIKAGDNPINGSPPAGVTWRDKETNLNATIRTDATPEGGYIVLEKEFTKGELEKTLPDGTKVARIPEQVRVALALEGSGKRLSVVPLAGRTTEDRITKTITAGGRKFIAEVGEDETGPSFEIDDPRISAHQKDWKWAEVNSFGYTNRRYLSEDKAPDSEPQQDTKDGTRGGELSDDSLRIPGPIGHTSNPFGKMTSVGELGFVHTGMQSTSPTATSIPWRTVRLQPSDADDDVVPDWALLDLFSVPPAIPQTATAAEAKRLQELYVPHNQTASAGKININATVDPFGSPTGSGSSFKRIIPLVALLKGVPSDFTDANARLSDVDSEKIAENIYTFQYSPNGGTKFGMLSDLYDSPGEIVEIEGVADNGEAGEELVRQILGLITTRSNVFTVYAVGQALRQDPNGNLTVTGEERTQAMIERYSTVVTDQATAEVKYRTVYNRSLTP